MHSSGPTRSPPRLEESRLGRDFFQGPSAERPPAVAGARIPGATYGARPGRRRSAPRVAARRIDAARDGLALEELLGLISRARFRGPGRRNDAQEVRLGNECLPNRCGCPSVRAVNRWNVLRVQLLGDLLERHSLPEQGVDLLPPYVVTLVAELVREPNVVGGEVTSVHLQPRVMVGRRRPVGQRRFRREVPTTPEAVALGHLATDVDKLAIPGELPEDSANAEGLEPLDGCLSSVRRFRWTSCLRDLLLVFHAGASQSSKVATSGLWSRKPIRGQAAQEGTRVQPRPRPEQAAYSPHAAWLLRRQSSDHGEVRMMRSA